MEPTSLPAAPETVDPETTELSGSLTRSTRRNFIRGVAAAGASTAAVAALERAGAGLFDATAQAAGPMPFSEFNALAASPADLFQVPDGYRADIVIKWGDEFADDAGTTYTYGFNNDYLAYFPLKGSDEGLLFVNHEYPGPFFQHGYKPTGKEPGRHTKSAAQIQQEQDAVGNSIVHIRRNADGVYSVVSPSPYNRRIHGDRPALEFTGPRRGDAGIGTSANGSVGNCSGGITPWGTALSCEENFDGYGLALGPLDFQYGWAESGEAADLEYNPGPPYRNNGTPYAKYGWVCEHDPYDPSSVPRKHTALGRFRHENTAFRQAPGKPFVLYMGDDKANEGVYKFISTRAYNPNRRAENLQILTAGTLYIAKFSPEGRRRFTTAGDTTPLTAESGTGEWVEVLASELDDTATKLRARFGTAAYDAQFATNRPEDVEVHPDGSVYVALTNNSSVRDSHGSIRRMVEASNDPTATTFAWQDYAEGGQKTSETDPGRQGFSSCDNLVFDSQENMWVVTDISSGSLNKTSGSGSEYGYHANNAVFMIPTKGANAGVAFRFANMPIQSEGTGPYFTPDEQTLFVAVQHPGEETGNSSGPEFGRPESYTSYWPFGNKSTETNPATPLPSTVAITKVPRKAEDPGSPVIPVPPVVPGKDTAGPTIQLNSPGRQSLRTLRGTGMGFKVQVNEPATITVTLNGRLTSVRRRAKASDAVASARGKLQRLGRAQRKVDRAGEFTFRLRPSARLRLLLRRERSVPGVVSVRAVDAAGNVKTRTKQVKFK